MFQHVSLSHLLTKWDNFKILTQEKFLGENSQISV